MAPVLHSIRVLTQPCTSGRPDIPFTTHRVVRRFRWAHQSWALHSFGCASYPSATSSVLLR
eukprot:5610958-Prymnesium_polylepis.1